MQQLRTISLAILLSALFVSAGRAEPIVSEKLLNQADIVSVWQSRLSIQEDEKINDMWLINNHLYILTDKNYMFCLNADTGKTILSFQAAKKNLPVLKPAIYENLAYIIGGNDLIVMDVANRGQVYRGQIVNPVIAAHAVNSKCLYTPGSNNRLRVLDLQGQRTKFVVSPDNVSNVTSVMAKEKYVIFTTASGNIISMTPDEPKKIWQYDTVRAIDAPVVEKNGFIYVSSRDTNIYKIDAVTGSLAWKFYCGSELTDSAAVTEKTVYQFAVGKGLYAISAKTGKTLWLLPSGISLLTEHNDKAYVVDKTGTCVVMNNKTGKKEKAVNFFRVLSSVSNSEDSRMFIRNGKDRIACIKPAK